MAKHVSSLSVSLFATVAPFVNGLKAGEKGVTSLVSKITHAGASILGLGGIAALAGGAIAGAFKLDKGFELAEQFETAGVQLRALTGDAGTAATMLKGLREFAVASPFEFPELLDTSKRLLAVGVSAQTIPPLLREIGDVAAGVGAPIGDIGDIFARVGAEGKVSSRELLEFGRDGIPVVQALAQHFHTTAAGVSAMAEAGQIGFRELQIAFDGMTSGSGRFAGILSAQSQTVGGLLHTLGGTVDEQLADIAEAAINTLNLKGGISALTGAVGSIGHLVAGAVESVKPRFDRLLVWVGSTARSVYAVAVPPFLAAVHAVTAAWGLIESFVTQHARPIVSAIVGIAGVLVAAGIPGILGGIAGGFMALGSIVAPVLAPIAAALGAVAVPALVLGGVIGFLASRFDLAGAAGKVFAAVGTFIAENWQSALDTAVAFGMGLVNLISGAFTAVAQITVAAWNVLSGAFSAGWGFIVGSSTSGASSTGAVFEGIVGHIESFAGGVTTALNMVGYLFSHLQDTVAVVGTGLALDVVTMGDRVGWVFTDVIPGTLRWAGGVFSDFMHFSATVFENLAANLVRVFTNLPGLIRGKVKFDDVWKPLTDGFEATTKGLPQIAAMQTGPLTQALTDMNTAAVNKLGDEMGNSIAAQASKADAAAKAVTSSIQATIKSFTSAPIKSPSIDKPEVPQPDPLKLKASIDPSNLALSVTPEIKQAKAVLSGSAEAQASRYLSPAAGMPSVPGVAGANNAMAKTRSEQQTREQQKSNEWLSRVEYNTRASNAAQVVTIG